MSRSHKRQNAPGQRQRHAGKHQQGVLDGVKGAEQQQEDQEKAQRHHEAQALPGGHQIFELAAPIQPAPRRERHLGRDLLLGVGDKRAEVAAADIGLHHNAAFAVFAADLVGAFGDLEPCHLSQGNVGRTVGAGSSGPQGGGAHRLATILLMWQGNAQRGQGVEILAQGLRQAHHQGEAPVAFKHQPRLPSAHGNRHHVLHIRDVQAIAGNGSAVNEHTQDGQARRLFDLHVRRARDTLEHLGNRRCSGLHGVKVIAVDFDGHVAAHAGNEFVKAHLDGLRELVVMPRDLLKSLFHTLDQGAFRLIRVWPLPRGA